MQYRLTYTLEFLEKYKSNIDKIILDVYNDYKLPYIFINIIDILNGYHLIYTCDNKSILYLEEKLKVKFNDGIYIEEGIVLRKEIKKYLKKL